MTSNDSQKKPPVFSPLFAYRIQFSHLPRKWGLSNSVFLLQYEILLNKMMQIEMVYIWGEDGATNEYRSRLVEYSYLFQTAEWTRSLLDTTAPCPGTWLRRGPTCPSPGTPAWRAAWTRWITFCSWSGRFCHKVCHQSPDRSRLTQSLQ